MASSSSSSSSLYPYPSTLNPSSFVSMKLCSSQDYPLWETQMLCLLESQELAGFIDGSIQTPEEVHWKTTVAEYQVWKRSDRLVKGWILGSLQQDVLATVVGCSTAMDVWTKLLSTFGTNLQVADTSKDVMTKTEQTFNSDGIKSQEGMSTPTTEEGHQEAEAVVAARHAKTFKDYPDLSMVNAANFLSVKLTRTNYDAWRMQIICLFRSQDLFSFISSPAPPEIISIPNDEKSIKNEAYRLWSRLDFLLKGWILGSITEDILPLVADLPTSRNVLAKLEETFLPNDNKRIFSENTKTKDQDAWERNDVSLYLPLYKAALEGDWETAEEFLDRNGNAATAIITVYNETVLHVAVGTGKANHFVEKLVERLPEDALNLKSRSGYTALHVAAMVGNVDAIKILMKRNPSLLSTRNDDGELPLDVSIYFGQRSTVTYLQSISRDDDYAGETAVYLLCGMIVAEFYDLALEFVKRYPHAASLHIKEHNSPLSLIAGMVSSFQSGMHLNYVESFIYSCVPVKFENYLNMPNRSDTDVENPSYNNSQTVHAKVQLRGVCQRLHLMLWDVIQGFVPRIKSIRHKKLVHHQAVQLVKYLCEGVKSSLREDAYLERTSGPITKAASLGVFEVVEEIADVIPYAMRSTDESGYYLHQIAVIGRCEKLFNLLYQMSGYQTHFITLTDDFNNCILHLAGRLAPPHKLNLVSGAALQMQRELQWFQEVEKHTHPALREWKNSSAETPAMVFTREHKELVIKGEKWMKDTANSCTIAAALIITVVFAAAITVPGGNNEDNGHPIFSGIAFWLFAVSDAISLFTSTTSLLMFLSILIARYAEQDFLYALPRRLVLGLFTLFLSITSMVIAFSSAVYLVFGDNRRWVIIALATLSCLPISSFVTLQFPLLGAVYSSTYGRGIFVKQSDRPLYQFI